jgi:hypothetical protein
LREGRTDGESSKGSERNRKVFKISPERKESYLEMRLIRKDG